MKDKNLSVRELANRLVDDFYKKQNASVLVSLSKRNFDDLVVSRKKIMEHIEKELGTYENADGSELTKAQREEVLDQVRKELWGYGVIDELIHDETVSDIKLHGYNKVIIKRKGKRSVSDIKFDSEEAYASFVTRLLERNRVNLGTANAIQTFTDATITDFVLRITAVSGLLTDTGIPCITIRKIPKIKYVFADLERDGMFTLRTGNKKQTYKKGYYCKNKELNELFPKMINSRGLIFTGKGASGKTTLMNACLSKVPYDEAVMICQENAEIFDNEHPDILSTHVLINGGDSKVSYTLGDLTRAALLLDMDRVIVGEVKEGQEAAGLSKASMTGHKCWTSVHGESCQMGIDKMVDYISQATGYTLEESLKQLTGFEYVVHLSEYMVDEIVRIDGWDKSKCELVVTNVYPVEGGVII